MGGLRKDIQMIDSDTLASRGFIVAPGLIGSAECRALASLWPEKPNFRSHVVMQRHGFGQGEYQYFAYPLPERIEALRQALYPELAAVANRWNEELGIAKRFPPSLQAWLKQCHAGGHQIPVAPRRAPARAASCEFTTGHGAAAFRRNRRRRRADHRRRA